MRKWRLDDFELMDPIGAGTVGTIFRAKIKDSGREVAVKILLPAVAHDKVVVARFEREMQVLERLAHPNITEYFGGGRDEGQLFFAMELMPAGTLRDLIEKTGPLNWQEVASIGRQICSALQFAHNHGIIHRDLKPGNLFLTNDGEIKLGDFGIAHDVDNREITRRGITVGTGAYMAPEQIRGDENITGQLDLYALGCVLYELLTGSPPFVGAGIANMIHQHLNVEAPHVREQGIDCPAELDELIHSLLAKDPDQRPFNARAVQGQLMDILGVGQAADAADPADVAAASVVDQGQEHLKARLKQTRGRSSNSQISWISLSLVIAIAVGLAFLASQWTG